jgi:hypothetical protein
VSPVLLAGREVAGRPQAPGGTPAAPPYARRQIDLLGVNGDRIRLSDPVRGLRVLADPAPVGLWMPEFAGDVEQTPGVDGARYGDILAAPRTVGVTVRFDVADVAEARALTDRVVRALNPKRGLAGLLVTEADASARMITGRYVGGELLATGARMRGAWRIELLCADDPFWTDAPGSEPPAQTWSAPDPVSIYPYLPYRVMPDTAIGDPVVIDNDGHEETYPDWLVHGPATSVLIVNDTTGEQLSWTGTLLAGEWLAIVTRPGTQEVVDSSGASRFHELDQDPEPSFWALAPGQQTIRTVLDGIGAGTAVTLQSRPRRWLVAG